MIIFKRFLVLIVLLFLILLTPTSLLAQDDDEIPFDKIKTPTEVQDIIDTFDSLKYNFVAFKEGEKAQELSVDFQYKGKEVVEDVQTDKVLINSSIATSKMESPQTSQMIFWIDDGEIAKLVQNEQEIPAAMAGMLKDQMLQSVFFPFYHFEELNIIDIASLGEVTRTQELIGEKEIDIIKIEGDNLIEYGLESGTIKLANFEEFMMAINFEYITLEELEAQYTEGQFEITEIELR